MTGGMADNARPGLHGSVVDRLGLLVVSGELPRARCCGWRSWSRGSGSPGRWSGRRSASWSRWGWSRAAAGSASRPPGWSLFDPRIIAWRLDGEGRGEQLGSLGELRRAVEPAAAALAAWRATPAQCGVLTGAVMEMAVRGRSGGLESYLIADVLFHRTLLEASGNEMMGALSGAVAAVLAGRTHHRLMPDRPERAAIRWHAEVAQAVQAGDADAAERAMRDIVDEAARAMPGPDG